MSHIIFRMVLWIAVCKECMDPKKWDIIVANASIEWKIQSITLNLKLMPTVENEHAAFGLSYMCCPSELLWIWLSSAKSLSEHPLAHNLPLQWHKHKNTIRTTRLASSTASIIYWLWFRVLSSQYIEMWQRTTKSEAWRGTFSSRYERIRLELYVSDESLMIKWLSILFPFLYLLLSCWKHQNKILAHLRVRRISNCELL